MKENIKIAARRVLDSYLETNHHRKTAERYAILDAVFGMERLFSIDELGEYLARGNFIVSRATLYNTMRLFIDLRIVVRLNLGNTTMYQASLNQSSHCHQVCTVCGKITEINSSSILKAVENTRLKRFRKESFSLYVYGVCSACQAKMTRKKSIERKSKVE